MVMGNSPLIPSVHMLDDDSLLNVFHLYRPFLLGEDADNDNVRLFGGERWARGRWWYKLAHVCQRWRNVILGSSSYLGVFLVCTNGTPVADMLARSPPLPLVIDHSLRYRDIPAEDEEGAILALNQHSRVRRVRLWMPVTNLPKLILAMDDEYPILEHLIIMYPVEDRSTILTFPETLQAPQLRHLTLFGFALPIRSRLLTTAVGLVTLCLAMVHPSTYFRPNTLLQWLSFMPQLETLVISFYSALPNRDLERQLTRTPNMTPVILPNIHVLRFQGVSTYLETFVHSVTAPHLERVEVVFFNQLTFTVPRLLEFLNAAENFRFESAKFKFSDDKVDVEVYLHEQAKIYGLSIIVNCLHLDWQVSSAAQIFNSLSPLFSTVEHLTFEHKVHSQSSEDHNEADRAGWCELFRSFKNVKTLRIAKGLVKELFHSLELDVGELPLELLPELQELTYFGSGDTTDTHTSFVGARQDVGRPLTQTLVLHSPIRDLGLSVSSLPRQLGRSR